MAEANVPTHALVRWSPVRTGFVLLTASWLVWALALARGAWIDSQFVGPGDDVTDSLRRAGYIAERLLPFECAVLVADAAAAVALLQASRWSWWAVVAWALLAPSIALHGLVLLVHLIVAG
ncbi:MAG TPA: hypothetical protein VGE74_17395 [Gemmata sp.]